MGLNIDWACIWEYLKSKMSFLHFDFEQFYPF